MIPGLIISILLLSLVLIKAADMVIVAIRRIAREVHAGIFTVAAIILALGTSLPELFVGITSALEGTPSLAFGVILGSNIANIALIGGVSALFIGKVHVKDYLNKDVWVSLFAAIAPLFLALDKSISSVDGLILVMIYFAYATGFFKRRYEEIGKARAEESFVYRFMREFKYVESVRKKEFIKLFLGLAVLLFSADTIVKLSSQLATLANIPVFLIGLFVLAIGTSLPEFVFSIRSLEDHEPRMFFGNLLGSTITNSTLIIGVTTLISPLRIEDFSEYIVAVLAFFAVFFLFWFFIKSKHRLDRWEAAVLVLLYATFVAIELL